MTLLEEKLNIFGGFFVIILSYIVLYYSPNLEQIKWLIPILCGICGYMIRDNLQ